MKLKCYIKQHEQIKAAQINANWVKNSVSWAFINADGIVSYHVHLVDFSMYQKGRQIYNESLGMYDFNAGGIVPYQVYLVYFSIYQKEKQI